MTQTSTPRMTGLFPTYTVTGLNTGDGELLIVAVYAGHHEDLNQAPTFTPQGWQRFSILTEAESPLGAEHKVRDMFDNDPDAFVLAVIS